MSSAENSSKATKTFKTIEAKPLSNIVPEETKDIVEAKHVELK